MMSWSLTDFGLALLDAFNVVVILYFILLNGTYLGMTFLAFGADSDEVSHPVRAKGAT
ncbi:MAG: hypothetical protein IIC35_09415 [Gemmatimonadetes bacterium]|nr:hypothetical protein [Gemmatimonadota bacterium]